MDTDPGHSSRTLTLWREARQVHLNEAAVRHPSTLQGSTHNLRKLLVFDSCPVVS